MFEMMKLIMNYIRNLILFTVDARMLSAVINRFLSSQKETARAIFLKRYWYMRPISEIAAETGFSESKVKVTLMRTRNALREYLGREDFNV